LKFYQQLTGEERRIPFIFDDFHLCRSRVIGLDITENRIFTLLSKKKTSIRYTPPLPTSVQPISITKTLLIVLTKNERDPPLFIGKLLQQLTGEERRIPFIFDDFHLCRSRVIGLDMTKNRIFILYHMIT
jgi:predicted RNA-binding protein